MPKHVAKLKIIILLAVFGFSVSAHAAVLSSAPNNLGLVLHWPLNEGSGTVAGDFSGNPNHCTFTNMDEATDWVGGKRGRALDFDGIDDRLDCGSDDFIDNVNVFTVSAWIYYTASKYYPCKKSL